MGILFVDDKTRLRLLEPGDAGVLFQMVDANRAHLQPWMPWVDATRSDANTLAFIEHALEEHESGLAFEYIIE